MSLRGLSSGVVNLSGSIIAEAMIGNTDLQSLGTGIPEPYWRKSKPQPFEQWFGFRPTLILTETIPYDN